MTPKEAVIRLLNGASLTRYEMETMVNEIMEGNSSDATIASILVLLRSKGETIEEIIGAVSAVLSHVDKIDLDEHALDTCGTGGDAAGTFNISTTSALIAHTAGVKIAKHGNRSISSKCGSADIMEALGFKIDASKEVTKKLFDETGFAFLYAPRYHKAMKYVANARKELGVRTMFNLIGPLSNPAGVLRQLLGVYDKELTGMFAQVLRQLGSEHCMILHGQTKEGIVLDEPSLCGSTTISELKNGTVMNYTVQPEDFGFKLHKLDEILGGDLAENTKILWQILDNTGSEAKRDTAIFAGGFAIYIGGKAETLEAGIKKSREVLESGQVKRNLEWLQEKHRLVTI